jgi:membrane-associated phospholipid phosphatase
VVDTAAVHVDSLSIYRIEPWVDGPVLGISALGAGLPLVFETQLIDKSCDCRREDVNRFDRPVIGNNSKTAGMASHLLVGVALVVPVVYDRVDVGWNKTFLEDMVVYTEVLSVTSALGNIARFGAQRPRPTAYIQPQPVTADQEFESFYSGHTANIMAGLTSASMMYTYRHGPSVWPWVMTGVATLTQGGLRLAAGRHFYTDVIMGIAVGALTGTTIPMLHHRKEARSWSVLPTVGEHDVGLVWERKF